MKFSPVVAVLCVSGCLMPAQEVTVGTYDAGSDAGQAAGGGGGPAGGGSAGGSSGGGSATGGGGALGPQTVETTDVSILYPLPVEGASTDFIQPSESGAHGQLLPQAFFERAVGVGGSVDANGQLSTYPNLRVVGLRLDPCSARVAGVQCTPEARLVFQALFQKTAGEEGDPVAGTAATDGAVHVIYDISQTELLALLQEILTLRHDNGDLTLTTLGPHPILAAQGLAGPFATGLRQSVLAHLGADRLARMTVFNHQSPEIDLWNFFVFDSNSSGGLDAGNIAVVDEPSQELFGSSALAAGGTLTQSSASFSTQKIVPDAVYALVSSGRPDAGTVAGTAFAQPLYEAALRVQNPTVHNVSNTDCANCHLAEGARQIGEQLYGLTSADAFSDARSLAHVDQRTSVTNLHAFGYLGRQVSIMSRTANESVVAAQTLQLMLQAH